VYLAFILFLSGCEKMSSSVTETMQKPLAFPITRTLLDNTGRPLEATIIGRGVNSITVIRKSDRARFDIPLDRLAPSDQEFAKGLPLTPAPPEVNVAATPPEKDSPGSLAFLITKRDELERKLEKNMELLITMDRNTVKGRSMKSERERMLNELAEIKADIYEEETR
jgi:hypothetical protein